MLERSTCAPGFPELVALARERGWGVRVLSSGFEEIDQAGARAHRASATSRSSRTASTPGRTAGASCWRDEAICAVCGEPCKRGEPAGGRRSCTSATGSPTAAPRLPRTRVFATRGLARYLDEIGRAVRAVRRLPRHRPTRSRVHVSWRHVTEHPHPRPRATSSALARALARVRARAAVRRTYVDVDEAVSCSEIEEYVETTSR